MSTEINLKQQVSCRVTNSILKYLESIGYDMESVVSGLPYTKEYLRDPFNWVEYDIRETIARRAAELTNNDAVMYDVGLSTPKLQPLGGVETLVRLLTGPKRVYKYVPKYASLFDKIYRFKTHINRANQATITMSITGDFPSSKASCYYAQGILAAIPTLWGLPPAEIREKTCMCAPEDTNGKAGVHYKAKTCVWEVQWQPLKSWYARLRDKLNWQEIRLSGKVGNLERSWRLVDQKNAELVMRNNQLAKVREIALGIDKLRTIDEVLSLVIEQAKQISGVLFLLIQKLDETGQNVITPYCSLLPDTFLENALKAIGFDPDKVLGKTPTSQKLKFPLSKLKVAQDYLSNPRVMVIPSLAELLDGVWPRKQCESIQKILGVKKFVIIPLMIDGVSWGNMLYFLTKEVPIDILEMIGAHCAIAIKNIGNIEALANEAIRRRILVEQSRDGIVILDQNGKVYETNRRFSEMLGYSVEEVLQLSVWDWEYLFPPEQVVEMIRTVDEKGDHFETKHRRKDGSIYDVEISTNGAIFAGQKLIFCVCRDITERKRAEEALKKSEENIRAQKELIERVLTTIPNAVFLVDRDFRIIIANQAAYNFLKISPQELGNDLVGRTLDVKELHQTFTNMISRGENSTSAEFRQVVEGRERILCADLFAIPNDEILLVINDVTNERDRQEKLYLTDRLASIGEMASGVAHELNNPLTSVIGLSGLLVKTDVPEDIKEDIIAIHSEAQRAATVVRNLLTFARRHTTTKEHTKLGSILEDVIKLRAYEQKANNITIKTDISPDLPEVLVDYYQIQQVFLNIILNAESAMAESHGGGTLLIQGQRVNGNVAISFSDDGPGVPEEIMGRIFDPFFTTKEVGKGTGLGLSICYGIVNSHGGNIHVKNQTGKGATFVVELPIHSQ